MRTFETEYQLEEWKRIEPEHFDCDGNAFTGQQMSGNVQEQMRALINRLEYKLTLIEGGYKNEKTLLKEVDNICIESLPPHDYENWERINEILKNNRKSLQ
jgi:hypothetical protein